MTDESIPAWWRVPQNKAPGQLRAGDVVTTPLGERVVKTVRQDETFVVDFMPCDEQRGPDKQVFDRDDFMPVVRLGEQMPTNDELVAVLQAVSEENEFRAPISITAYDEATRRGWVEHAHRLTTSGKMVIEALKAKGT